MARAGSAGTATTSTSASAATGGDAGLLLAWQPCTPQRCAADLDGVGLSVLGANPSPALSTPCDDAWRGEGTGGG